MSANTNQSRDEAAERIRAMLPARLAHDPDVRVGVNFPTPTAHGRVCQLAYPPKSRRPIKVQICTLIFQPKAPRTCCSSQRAIILSTLSEP
jgi:hypothetical protein